MMSINIFTNQTILELAHPEYTEIASQIRLDDKLSGGLAEVSYTIDDVLYPIFVGVTSAYWRLGMRRLAIVPILDDGEDQSEIFLSRIVPSTFLNYDGLTISDTLQTTELLHIYRRSGRLVTAWRFNTFLGPTEIRLGFRGLGSVT